MAASSSQLRSARPLARPRLDADGDKNTTKFAKFDAPNTEPVPKLENSEAPAKLNATYSAEQMDEIMKVGIATSLALAMFCTFAEASENESQKLVRSGRIAWVAANCATYSELIGNSKNQERYFYIALREGRLFFSGLSRGAISDEDASKSLPIMMYDSFSGPNVEFKLGSMYAMSSMSVYDELEKLDDERRDRDPEFYNSKRFEDLQADKSNDLKSLYWKSNCDALN